MSVVTAFSSGGTILAEVRGCLPRPVVARLEGYGDEVFDVIGDGETWGIRVDGGDPRETLAKLALAVRLAAPRVEPQEVTLTPVDLGELEEMAWKLGEVIIGGTA